MPQPLAPAFGVDLCRVGGLEGFLPRQVEIRSEPQAYSTPTRSNRSRRPDGMRSRTARLLATGVAPPERAGIRHRNQSRRGHTAA